MKSYIQIPEGLKVPANAESKPFTAEVQFLVADGMLMPVSIAGKALAMEEDAPEEEEDMMSEEAPESGGEMEEEMPKGEGMPPEKERGGFMIAIERALAAPKR